MKTKQVISLSLIFFVALIFASCNQSGKNNKAASTQNDQKVEIENVTINPEQSRVVWEGTMLGVYSHDGTLDLTQADIEMKNGKINGGSFTADMNSMVATDDNYNPEEGSTPEKLIGHLKSPDFFDVENYPVANFVITGSDGNKVMGNMTIRGITHEETVENVTMTKEDGQVKITGDMVIDRKKYDVSWDSPMEDRVLSNDLDLEIHLIGK